MSSQVHYNDLRAMNESDIQGIVGEKGMFRHFTWNVLNKGLFAKSVTTITTYTTDIW